MTEIDVDIREKAEELASQIDGECAWGDGNYGLNQSRAAEIIAAALMAERGRCAAAA